MVSGAFEIEVEPEVLIWARTSMGKEVSEVAEALKVDISQIEAWEKGENRPTMTHLRSLAKYYKRPLAALLLPEPPMDPPLPDDFRTLPDERALPLSETTRLAIRRARRLQAIASELDMEGLTTRFRERFGRYRIDISPERMATEVRGILGVSWDEQYLWENGMDALKRWRAAVEDQGVLVMQLPMEIQEVRAFSLTDGPVPVIVINSRDSTSARTFSLMHELCHLLVDSGGVCMPTRASRWETGNEPGEIRIKKVEIFCNHFAGALLVPKESLLIQPLVKHTETSRIWPVRDLEALSKKYKVSKEVILRRLLHFQKTTRVYYNEMHERWASGDEGVAGVRGRGGKGRDMSRECLSQNGAPFVEMVLESYRKERITLNDVSDYLDVKLKHIPRIEETIGAR